MVLWYSVLAYVGGFILGFQMFPQIYKVFVTKSATDLSLVYLSMNAIGLVCMTTFGIKTNQLELYIPTSISLTTTIVMIFMKLYYDYKKTTVHLHTINVETL
jgi:uncharacterized protein with PQ loop repeat